MIIPMPIYYTNSSSSDCYYEGECPLVIEVLLKMIILLCIVIIFYLFIKTYIEEYRDEFTSHRISFEAIIVGLFLLSILLLLTIVVMWMMIS